MFLSFFFLFILGDGNFFDEKDIKKRRRGVNNRASSLKVTAFQRKKKRQMMSKYVAFSLLFFDENTYIKKKKTIISSISPPSSMYQSMDRMMKAFYDVVQTLFVSHAVVQMVHFLSYDLATYLNCFLMAFPSISTNLKVLVA